MAAGRGAADVSRTEFWILTTVGFALLFGAWTVGSVGGVMPRQFMPTPIDVARELFELFRHPFAGYLYQQHVLASLERFSMGWAIAVAVGIPLGLLMGWFRVLDELVTPLFDAVRFIAPLAWVPLAALWFGASIGGPLLIIFVGSFAPCVISAYRGARLVDRTLVEAGQTVGASSWQIVRHILLPGAFPSIVAGLRISAGFGWLSLVGSELIVVGPGLGYLMVLGQGNLSTVTVMAGMVGVGVIGFSIDGLLRALQRVVRRRWGQQT